MARPGEGLAPLGLTLGKIAYVVVVVALFNVCRQPKAAKDGPGFMPWQAYHTHRKTLGKKKERQRWHRRQNLPEITKVLCGLCL